MSENIKAAPRVHNFKKPKTGNQDHSVHQVTVYQVLCVAALIIVALLFTFPLYWIITGSFKGPQAVNARVPVWFPTEPTLLNYEKLFEKPALMWMFNTVFVCALAMLFTCVAASMGGYALAKKRFTGRALIFSIFVCAMALPKQVILIPLLKEMAFLNLHNTLWAVILPTVGWPFGVFLMKQFSEGIPSSLLEAARIDGAGEVKTFMNVALPIIQPGIGALAIFTFINAWNEYPLQLIMLSKSEAKTIALGIAGLQSEMSNDYGLIMAGAALAAVPIIIVFLCFQKYFTQGITMGAVKG